jgi:D-glycero-alpha-D-manno-heptose-7-phosphate kinase
LLLFYTGTSRLASEIAADVVTNMESKQEKLRQMRSFVDQALGILSGDGSLDDFGCLLHENWMLKRELSKMITNPTIDGIYNTAIENGALGGKLLGAGASGFMVFYVPCDKQQSVKNALVSYLHVPFNFESQGSTLVHYEVDGS